MSVFCFRSCALFLSRLQHTSFQSGPFRQRAALSLWRDKNVLKASFHLFSKKTVCVCFDISATSKIEKNLYLKGGSLVFKNDNRSKLIFPFSFQPCPELMKCLSLSGVTKFILYSLQTGFRGPYNECVEGNKNLLPEKSTHKGGGPAGAPGEGGPREGPAQERRRSRKRSVRKTDMTMAAHLHAPA